MIAVSYLICRWSPPGSLLDCHLFNTTRNASSSRDSGSVAKDGIYISAVDHCLSQLQTHRSIGPIPHQLHLKAIRVEQDVEKFMIDSFFFHTSEKHTLPFLSLLSEA